MSTSPICPGGYPADERFRDPQLYGFICQRHIDGDCDCWSSDDDAHTRIEGGDDR